MTTIGTAVLQIIPSLRGVTAEIEKQLGNETVKVAVEPTVDQSAAKKAGKDAGGTIAKEAKDAVQKGDVGKVIADDVKKSTNGVGKEAGEKIAKETKDAVKKSDIGKEVAKDVEESVKKSSPGKGIAETILDGFLEGVKQGMPKGGIGEVIVDGLADGVKKGIDTKGIGGQIVGSITQVIKSGDLPGKIKDTIGSGLNGLGTLIGDQLTAGAGQWSSGVAEALRSGDIEAATTAISDTVIATTDTIANIGEAFGLQLEGVRLFGQDASTVISNLGSSAEPLQTVMGNVSSGIEGLGPKADKAAAGINKAMQLITIPAALYEILNGVAQQKIQQWDENYWKRWEEDQKARELGIKPAQPGVGDFGGAPAVGQGGAAQAPTRPRAPDVLRQQIAAGQMRGFTIGPDGKIYGPDGKPLPGLNTGGYTGNLPTSKIAGVVHGNEYVVNAPSRKIIEGAYPGLLDSLNATGRLPGFEDGGRVPYGLAAGTNTGGYGSSGTAFPEWVHAIESKFGVKASTHSGHQEKSGQNKGIDWVGPVDKMQAFAEYLAANRGQLEQVIWMNPNTGQKIGVADGQLVGPGTSQPGYYAADWGGHANHVHTRQSYSFGGSAAAPKPAAAAAMGVSPGSASTTTPAATTAAAAPSASGFGLPSTIPGLASMGLSDIGKGVGATRSGSDLSVFGQAAGAAVSDQVASALGVFGVNGAPGFLKAASQLVGGISIGGGDSAAPLSASPSGGGLALPSLQHGSQAGQQPGPSVVYNIAARDTEDMFIRANRVEREKSAAKLSRY